MFLPATADNWPYPIYPYTPPDRPMRAETTGTVAPPGVCRPRLETKIPLRTNGNQGKWRRVMGAGSKRQGSPIQSRGPWSLRGWSPNRQIHRAGAHHGGGSSRTPGSCLRSTGTYGGRRCSGRLPRWLYWIDRMKNHLRLARNVKPERSKIAEPARQRNLESVRI